MATETPQKNNGKKKKIAIIIAAVLLLILILMLSLYFGGVFDNKKPQSKKERTIIIYGIVTDVDGTTEELKTPVKTIKTEYGKTVTLSAEYPDTLTAEDYDFDGYYADNQLTGDKIIGEYKVEFKDSLTLYANYKKIYKVTLSFDANDGNGSYQDMTVTPTDDVYAFTQEEKSALFAAFSREDYMLGGFSLASDGAGSWTVAFANKQTAATLYAIWKEPLSVLSFDLNLPDGEESSQTVAGMKVYEGTTFMFENLPSAQHTTNYVFTGWNTESDGSGTTYEAGEDFTTENASNTLYGVWSDWEKTITYNYTIFGRKGNEVKTDLLKTSTKNYSETETLDETPAYPSDMLLEDYEFDGYYTDDTFETKIEDNSFTVKSDRTIYAKFIRNEVILKYDMNGHGSYAASYFSDDAILSSESSSYDFSTNPKVFGIQLHEITWYYDSISLDKDDEVGHLDGYDFSPYVNQEVTVYLVWKQYIFEYDRYNTSTVAGYSDYGEGLKLANLTVSEREGKGTTGIYKIGDSAFIYDSYLENLTVEKISSIGQRAFLNCYNLKFATIDVNSIGYQAFTYCTSLTTVVLSKRVNQIDAWAFNDCTSLEAVYYEGTSDDWGNVTIGKNNDSLTDATIYFYSEDPPQGDGNYWHYDGGVPTVW